MEQIGGTMNYNCQIFSNETKVNFRLREPNGVKPTQVYMCLTINNKKHKIATGVKVYPKHWNTDKQLAYTSPILSALDNRNNETANSKIKECKMIFNEYKEYLCENLDSLDNGDADYLKKRLNSKKRNMGNKKYANPIIYLEQIVDKQNFKEGSKKVYQTGINYLKSYCIDNNIVIKDVKEIDYNFLFTFREWLKQQSSIRNKKDGEKLSIGLINNSISNIKHILKLIDDDTIFDFDKSKITKIKALKLSKTNDNEIALTETEFETICNLELIDKEAKIRDAFVFQACTGQRFNDIFKFKDTFTEVDTPDGKVWQVTQQKGTKTVKVPMSNLAKRILERNNGIVEYKHNSITNEILKEIARKAGMTQECTLTKHTSDGIRTHKRKRYELLTTHAARRTFVTISKQNDIDDRQVMSVTGHTTRIMLDLYNKVDAGKAAIKVAEKLDDVFEIENNEVRHTTSKVEISKITEKKDSTKDLIDEAKRILAYLGADAITIADIKNIDDANRLIYTDYERKLTDMGVDYHIIKDLYNDTDKATLREKRKALDVIVNAIKNNS